MGYFANGSEWERYEAAYCEYCQHNDAGCAIQYAHFLHAYEECGKKSAGEQILSILIPRDGVANKQCALYLPIPRH